MAVMKYGKNGMLEIVTKTEVLTKKLTDIDAEIAKKSEKTLKTTPPKNKKGEAKNAR